MLQPPHAPLPSESGPRLDSGDTTRGPSRLPNVIAIGIAVVAVAVAAGAWFRPLPKPETPTAKVYSQQEVADAKNAVCEAFAKGQETLAISGSKVSSPNDEFTVAVNSRISIQAVSTYLRLSLETQPATPAEVSKTVLDLSDVYQAILLDQLADATHDELSPLYSSLDASLLSVRQACA